MCQIFFTNEDVNNCDFLFIYRNNDKIWDKTLKKIFSKNPFFKEDCLKY